MKYTTTTPPIVCMQTQSRCYKNTNKMQIKGVLWHSTGCNNPTLKRYVQPSDDAVDRDEMLKIIGVNTGGSDWNHKQVSAGLNAWIGKLADGSVATVQTMPWDYAPWGCGGSCNNGWIQFEICEDNLTDPEYFSKVYNEACELTAYLCKLYNLDPYGKVFFKGKEVPTILCHWDSYLLGMGSGHVDVTHWLPKFGKSMQTVRDDVVKILQDGFIKDGLDFSPVFDPVYYSDKYSDIKNALGDNAYFLFDHFITYGMDEGRQAKDTFNPTTYRATYPDLDKMFGDSWRDYYLHYLIFGKQEIEDGRRCPYEPNC